MLLSRAVLGFERHSFPLVFSNATSGSLTRRCFATPTSRTDRNARDSDRGLGVHAMDRYLNIIRDRSDPTQHSVMPLRTASQWSETVVLSSKKLPNASYNRAAFVATPRHIHDSYCELLLPFASSPQLLEEYTNASGGLRCGKIFEHLDLLAGSVAYKHNLGPNLQALGSIEERGFYIVTAAVDRLDMLAPLKPVDLRLSGQVMYVGKSSIDVVLRLEAIAKDGPDETLMLGHFCMACRDAHTHLAHPVIPLIISTPEEKALNDMGKKNKMRRLMQARQALTRVAPTGIEAKQLHTLLYGQYTDAYIPNTKQCDEIVWMSDTRLENFMLMFPQERNVHQKIFGGYLMRLAYELGFTNATLFTRSPVRFSSLDRILFTQPVSIGSILRQRSMIMHTATSENRLSLVHVGVETNVVDVSTGSEQTMSNFRFTWAVDGPLTRMVVPKTYEESMLWLEGRRTLGAMPHLSSKPWKEKAARHE